MDIINIDIKTGVESLKLVIPLHIIVHTIGNIFHVVIDV